MRSSLTAAAVALSLFAFDGVAQATPRAECLSAYEAAQRARKSADLVTAKSELERCASQQCPEIARADCVKWLDEVDQALPSVVFRVKSADNAEVDAASVWLDDTLVQNRIDGRAVALNPGEHRVRVERGETRVERKIVAAQGEKNRMIVIALPAPAPPPVVVEPAPDRTKPSSAPPIAAWVLAGVSLVGFASFGYFALTGTQDLDELRSSCAPNCRESELDAARRKLIIADVSLAVGVISAGAATWLFLAPTSDGTAVAVGTRF